MWWKVAVSLILLVPAAVGSGSPSIKSLLAPDWTTFADYTKSGAVIVKPNSKGFTRTAGTVAPEVLALYVTVPAEGTTVLSFWYAIPCWYQTVPPEYYRVRVFIDDDEYIKNFVCQADPVSAAGEHVAITIPPIFHGRDVNVRWEVLMNSTVAWSVMEVFEVHILHIPATASGPSVPVLNPEMSVPLPLPWTTYEGIYPTDKLTLQYSKPIKICPFGQLHIRHYPSGDLVYQLLFPRGSKLEDPPYDMVAAVGNVLTVRVPKLLPGQYELSIVGIAADPATGLPLPAANYTFDIQPVYNTPPILSVLMNETFVTYPNANWSYAYPEAPDANTYSYKATVDGLSVLQIQQDHMNGRPMGTTTNFTVPAAESTQLRFLHKFNCVPEVISASVELRDLTVPLFGIVKIWEECRPGASYWVPVTIDLTPWAGRHVQISFLLRAAMSTTMYVSQAMWLLTNVELVTIPYFDPAPTSLVAPMPSVELEAKLIHSFPLPRTAMTWGSNIISLVFDRPVLLARNRPEITVSRLALGDTDDPAPQAFLVRLYGDA